MNCKFCEKPADGYLNMNPVVKIMICMACELKMASRGYVPAGAAKSLKDVRGTTRVKRI